MLKTNVAGSLAVCLVLFTILAYLLHLGISLDWDLYFKVAGVVLIIAVIIGLASYSSDKS